MPLNINIQQIVLHALNFVILFGALYFLLYKPVKSYMDGRRAQYEKMDAEAKEHLAQAEQTRAGYEEKLKGVETEIRDRREKAMQAMQQEADAARAQASAEAGTILKNARANAAAEYDKTMAQAQDEISNLVSAATEKLVLKSSAAEAYDQFLSAAERGGGDE